jgi:ectoine hydroxylase-related dioxygenase (phytanoyl-CoA dioxygenase family)
MWQREPTLADFCFNSPLAEIASQLLCTTKVNLLYHQIFVKDSSEIAERTDWHNDLAYWPVRGSTMSLWLALDEVDEERGALEFIRGSHDWNRWFDIVGPVERNSDFEPLPKFDVERDKHEMLSWQMQPGDVVGFHALTVHGAYANRKPN